MNHGLSFRLICPVSPNVVYLKMFIFNNGSIYNNFNFKYLCPIKQKERPAKLAFERGYDGLYVKKNAKGELTEEMYEHPPISSSLQFSGDLSTIPWAWEKLKLFITVFNIKPIWIDTMFLVGNCKNIECIAEIVNIYSVLWLNELFLIF